MAFQSAHKESDMTPPGSLMKAPLIPPPSEQKSELAEQQIIQEIERRKIGRSLSTNPWLRYRLSQAAYERIEKHFENDGFVQDKLKCDYFAFTKIFVLRRPSALHESMKADINFNIHMQLRSISNGVGPTSVFAKSIHHEGSASIMSDDGRHDPDARFRHQEAHFPGVILEISYPQKRKDMTCLVEDYILGSDGNIRVVVVIDVEYKGKSATLSIWRPRLQTNEAGEEELVAHQILSNQEFRKENGEVNPQTGLRLCLEDFAPPSLSEHIKFDRDIFISSTDLCTYLHEAEENQVKVDQGLGYREPLKPGVKKYYRLKRAPEELNTDDESRYQEEEERAAEKLSQGDSEYHEDS